jgi:glycosyltransferase involved in cell wall biosynthesis
MKIVAVIPAYNEGESILKVVKDVEKYVDKVIVIDDGSTDNTVKYADQSNAVVIRHPHNLGKGAACRSGFHAAVKLGCDAIITLDGDGQHDASDIPNFIKKASDKNAKISIVLGNRMTDVEKMPFVRYMTNKSLSLLISFLAGQKITDSQCGFRLIFKEILEKVDYENNRYDAESEILVRASRAGYLVEEVPVQTIYNNEFSKIHVFWDTLRFVRFFFRHLFHSPPVAFSEAKKISENLGTSVAERELRTS